MGLVKSYTLEDSNLEELRELVEATKDFPPETKVVVTVQPKFSTRGSPIGNVTLIKPRDNDG